jgi:hypothetical protein
VSIFFVGDRVRATVNGDQRIGGVIREFTHDVRAIVLGAPQDVALVEVSESDSANVVGEWLLVPCTDLEPAA